jgi:hypothetical protein
MTIGDRLTRESRSIEFSMLSRGQTRCGFWPPGEIIVIPESRGLLWQDLGKIGQNFGDAFRVEFAIGEGVVGFDVAFVVKDDGHIRFFGNGPGLGPGDIVDGQNGVLEADLGGVRFEFFRQFFVVAEVNDEALEAMSAFGIEFLDQTGQGIAVLPNEEGSDRASAKLSDEAILRAGAFAVDIERMKRCGALADGQARGDVLREDHGQTGRARRENTQRSQHHVSLPWEKGTGPPWAIIGKVDDRGQARLFRALIRATGSAPRHALLYRPRL